MIISRQIPIFIAADTGCRTAGKRVRGEGPDILSQPFTSEFMDMKPVPSQPKPRSTPLPKADEAPSDSTAPEAEPAGELNDADLEKLSGGGIPFRFRPDCSHCQGP